MPDLYTIAKALEGMHLSIDPLQHLKVDKVEFSINSKKIYRLFTRLFCHMDDGDVILFKLVNKIELEEFFENLRYEDSDDEFKMNTVLNVLDTQIKISICTSEYKFNSNSSFELFCLIEEI